MSQEPIKLMVVEDHPIVRDGVVNYLNAHDNLHVVKTIDCLPSLQQYLNQIDNAGGAIAEQIDIILLDLQLQQKNSLSVISPLVQQGVRVLVLSSTQQPETIQQPTRRSH